MVMMGEIGNLILEKDERKKSKIKITSKLEIMSIIIE